MDHPSPELVQQLVQGVFEKGPNRYLVDAAGDAVPPQRAQDAGLPPPKWIFIRNDAWSICATAGLRLAAYSLWPRDWTVIVDCQSKETYSPLTWLQLFGGP